MGLNEKFKESIRNLILYTATFLAFIIPTTHDTIKTQRSELTTLNREGESLVFRISNNKTEFVAYDDNRDTVLDRQTKGANSTDVRNLFILLFSPVEYKFVDAPVDPGVQLRYLDYLTNNRNMLADMKTDSSGSIQLGWWYRYAKDNPSVRGFGKTIWGENWFERAHEYPPGLLRETPVASHTK
jgi:hypothetical protein